MLCFHLGDLAAESRLVVVMVHDSKLERMEEGGKDAEDEQRRERKMT